MISSHDVFVYPYRTYFPYLIAPCQMPPLPRGPMPGVPLPLPACQVSPILRYVDRTWFPFTYSRIPGDSCNRLNAGLMIDDVTSRGEPVPSVTLGLRICRNRIGRENDCARTSESDRPRHSSNDSFIVAVVRRSRFHEANRFVFQLAVLCHSLPSLLKKR